MEKKSGEGGGYRSTPTSYVLYTYIKGVVNDRFWHFQIRKVNNRMLELFNLTMGGLGGGSKVAFSPPQNFTHPRVSPPLPPYKPFSRGGGAKQILAGVRLKFYALRAKWYLNL